MKPKLPKDFQRRNFVLLSSVRVNMSMGVVSHPIIYPFHETASQICLDKRNIINSDKIKLPGSVYKEKPICHIFDIAKRTL